MSFKEKLEEVAAETLLTGGGMIPRWGTILTAVDNCEKIGDELDRQVEKLQQRKNESFLKKEDGHVKLIAADMKDVWRSVYRIYDDRQYLRFFVKGEILSLKHTLHLYDAGSGSELAVIKEKMFAQRPVAGIESGAKDFDVYMKGEKIGTISTRDAYGKKALQTTFRSWRIEGDLQGKEFQVISENEDIIMKISRKGNDSSGIHYIDICNRDNEILGIIIMLTVKMI